MKQSFWSMSCEETLQQVGSSREGLSAAQAAIKAGK